VRKYTVLSDRESTHNVALSIAWTEENNFNNNKTYANFSEKYAGKEIYDNISAYIYCDLNKKKAYAQQNVTTSWSTRMFYAGLDS